MPSPLLKIAVVNGPNLNLLGQREAEHYGTETLSDINTRLQQSALEQQIELRFIQSNHEGVLLDFIHENRHQLSGMIINAGALSHYSVALYDALKLLPCPFIEVHMSNIYARESFRQNSLLSPLAAGIITGLGALSYELALAALIKIIKS